LNTVRDLVYGGGPEEVKILERKKVMARKSHRRPRHRARHRRNPSRSHTRRRSRRTKAKGRTRPVVIVSGGSYHRNKKTKRSRSRPRRAYRRSGQLLGNAMNLGSIKRILQLRNIFHYLSIGGGILAGAFLTRFFTTGNVPFMVPNATPPAWASASSWWGKLRPVHGLIHVVAGSMTAGKAKNPYLKDAGIGLASIGGYDLLTQLLTLAGMTGIPTLSGMDVSVYGGMNYTRRPGTVLGGGSRGIMPNAPGVYLGGAEGGDNRTMAEMVQSQMLGF
jgi:hypothetical protein